MTALDIEIAPIEGIDLENTPPCNAADVSGIPADERTWTNIRECKEPSVVRLHVTHDCGLDEYYFYCQRHADDITRGNACCDRCQSPYGARGSEA